MESSMLKRTALLLGVCAIAVVPPAFAAPTNAPQIDIRFEPAASWRARVGARFPGPVEAVVMANYGADPYPRGWAQFVRDLQADDCAGKQVALIADPKAARWKL